MSNTADGIHLTTNPKGTGWVNQANGQILSSHKFKTAAITKGRRLAKKHGAELSIHRRDGEVIQTKSYAPTALD